MTVPTGSESRGTVTSRTCFKYDEQNICEQILWEELDWWRGQTGEGKS